MEEELQPSADDELVPLEALEPSDAEIAEFEEDIEPRELKRKHLLDGVKRKDNLDDVGQMIEEYCSTPLLERDEEIALGHRTKAGDEVARAHMIMANLRLVVSIAKGFQNMGVDLVDLINDGSIGLIMAVERWDVDRGFKFSTYATYWIRQVIMRALTDKSRTIRIPVHIIEQIYRMQRADQKHAVETGKKASLEELAKRTGFDTDTIRFLKKARGTPHSLEEKIAKGSHSDKHDTLGSAIPDKNSAQNDAGLQNADVRAAVMRALHSSEHIAPDQREIFLLRTGMKDGTRHTKKEIAHVMGITRSNVQEHLKFVHRVLSKDPATLEIATLLDFNTGQSEKHFKSARTDQHITTVVAPTAPETSTVPTNVPLYPEEMRIAVLGALRNSTKIKASCIETFILHYGLESNERLNISETARRIGIATDKVRNHLNLVHRVLYKDPTVALFLGKDGKLKEFTTQHPDLR